MQKRNIYKMLLVVIFINIAIIGARVFADIPQPSVHFYFVQITDTHLGAIDNVARTRKVVDCINKLSQKIDFVVLTGDISQTGNFDDPKVKCGLEALAKIKVPIYYMPGNHDIRKDSGCYATPESYQKHFGPLVYKVEYEGVVFIMFCAEPMDDSMTIKGYNSLKWLEDNLTEAGNKPVIIFTHSPTTELYWTRAERKGLPKVIREKWEALLSSHNVKAVICGHYHNDELHWIGNIPMYIAAPVAGQYGLNTTYRIYEYNDEKLGYTTKHVR